MRELFRAERLPVLQNRTYETAAAAHASPTGDVVLVQDSQTGLVFNAAFDQSKLSYDADYQNEQACSGVFRQHLDSVAAIVDRHLAGRTLIEVGCGKGTFLELLRERGYAITGIDPAYEGENPDVIKAPFEAGLGLSAEGVVMRHVLEHMQDPLSFLSAIAAANGGRGIAYIEVPCLDWICAHRAWFDIFYEHVNYFRLVDFDRMFGRVIDRGHVFGGQYLYAMVDMATLRAPRASAQDLIDLPGDFMAGVERAGALAGGAARRNAIWGAASKGVIFATHLMRRGVTFDVAIDINPAKQGRYLPVTALRVASAAEGAALLAPGDNVFVMNSNYLDEIITQSNNAYSYITVDHEQLL
jgi:hypothetical protein